MNNLPDFSQYGYQIISQLGENHLGGRVTYLAQSQTSQVVIKQFQFAQMGATWAEYDAYEQEIAILRQLNHPGIAKYIDAFQTPDGFCMVQQYLEAESLATPRSWTPKQIKQIAVSILEILVYLQSQNPSVIHRDIKPENILIDAEMNIYLVDFGFARMGGGEIAASSVVKGTMGFMPPEQLFNRQLTTASDLYGLGGTLICLLTGTKSVDIGNLIDPDYRINFRHLVPPVKRGLISWLEKLADPRLTHRYSSAADALAALKPIDVDRLPKARLSHKSLEITATEFGEILTKTITISNPIPDTILSGRFSVAPHPSDPPHTPYDHTWISFEPQQFSGNEVECKITIDPSQLLAGESYRREVVLHSNSSSDIDGFSIKLHTAPLPNYQKKSYLLLFLILIASCLAGSFLGAYPIILRLPLPGLLPVLVAFYITNQPGLKQVNIEYQKALIGAFIFHLILVLNPLHLDIAQFSFILLLGNCLGALIGIKIIKIGESFIDIFIGILISVIMLIFWSHLIFILLIIFYGGFGLFIGGIITLSLEKTIGGLFCLIVVFFIYLFYRYIKARKKRILFELKNNNYMVNFIVFFGISIGSFFILKLQIIDNLFWLDTTRIIWLKRIGLAFVIFASIGLGYHLIKHIKNIRKLAKYRRSKTSLIKP